MSGSVNKVIIIGNLGRDPEIRATQNGKRVANLTVATSENWKDKSTGERKERTEWHKVAIFNDVLADVAEKCLKKGAKVYLEGALQTRKWVDNGGKERYTTEIVLQEFRGVLTMLGGVLKPNQEARLSQDELSRLSQDELSRLLTLARRGSTRSNDGMTEEQGAVYRPAVVPMGGDVLDDDIPF